MEFARFCKKPLLYLGDEATCTYCVSTGNREAFEAAMKKAPRELQSRADHPYSYRPLSPTPASRPLSKTSVLPVAKS